VVVFIAFPVFHSADCCTYLVFLVALTGHLLTCV